LTWIRQFWLGSPTGKQPIGIMRQLDPREHDQPGVRIAQRDLTAGVARRASSLTRL